MKAHELARKLLEGPDVRVIIPNIEVGGYTGVVEGFGDAQNVLYRGSSVQEAVVSLAFEETDLETGVD